MKANRFVLLLLTGALVVVGCAKNTSKSSSNEPISSSNEPASSSGEVSSSSEQSILSSAESSASSDASSSSSSSNSSSSLPPETKLVDKEVKVYRLFNRDNTYLDPDLSEDKYILGSIPMSFIEGQEFVPYITLDNASALYGRFYLDKDKTKNAVSDSEGKYTWKITNSDKEVFKSVIDINEKTFTYSGSLESYIETKKDYSKHSIFLRTKSETTTINLPSTHEPLISYADTEFEVVKKDGKAYFPFSMIHTLYHELVGHDFFYNYTYLYEYNDVDDISKAGVTEGDKIYTPLEQMGEYISEHATEKDRGNKPLMPMYLRKHHRSEFTLMMNNYYGLKRTWGVKSMKEFYSVYGLYDKFIDDSAAVRGAAYSQAFFMLADNHTGRTILGDDPWIESNGDAEIDGAVRADKTNERSLLSNALTAQREAFLKANGFEELRNSVVYSADGKTAYLGFDGFEGTPKAYNSDGTVKSDDSLANSDSYFYFVKHLEIIKNHETIVEGAPVKVERVIIDDSLNGGGYVAVMGRLLALLSKDNNSTLYFLNDLTESVTKQVYHVDTNKDGVYDGNDCYGNIFKNIYILTSPVSFSCGNAFPIFAQKQYSNVHIIGTKSGGGECVVGENYLSNGMGFAHSSNEHIIVFDETKQTYQGVENGVIVDGTIKYNDYYNMDAMLKTISTIEKQA